MSPRLPGADAEPARPRRLWPPALIVALGLFLGLVNLGEGLRKLRTDDRYVTVKGIAEIQVEADIALWPLHHTGTGDDLGQVQQQIDDNRQAIVTFLQGHGIDDVDVQSLQVTDVKANPYRSGPVESRYIIEQALMVRSADPALVEAASQDIGALVAQGIVLGGQHGMASVPTYLFTRLSDYKPQMLAEATANARVVAEQFAADSGSEVGGIRHANQGVFQILARDQAPGVMENAQRHKTVRVVTTVQYFLKD